MTIKTPIQTLRDEHTAARKAVMVLDSLAAKLKKRRPVSLLNVRDVVEAIRTAMESHHQKEMETFPYLVEDENVTRKDLLDALAEEHRLGYEYLSNIFRIAERKNKGEHEKYELLPFHIDKYTEMLKAHIEKEERGFFPLVEEGVPEDRQLELSSAFEAIDKKNGSRSAFDFILRLKAH